MDLFLGPLFYSIYLCSCFYASTMLNLSVLLCSLTMNLSGIIFISIPLDNLIAMVIVVIMYDVMVGLRGSEIRDMKLGQLGENARSRRQLRFNSLFQQRHRAAVLQQGHDTPSHGGGTFYTPVKQYWHTAKVEAHAYILSTWLHEGRSAEFLLLGS